jgi:hypothetical protein
MSPEVPYAHAVISDLCFLHRSPHALPPKAFFMTPSWFAGLNSELGDRVPVRLLREEDVETVGPETLGAARAFLAGGIAILENLRRDL